MLTKKQLKELAKNYGMEVTVGDIPAVAAAKVALAYREMLERLEFAGKSDMGGWKCCPICGVGIDDRNHASDCELAKLLKESEGEK